MGVAHLAKIFCEKLMRSDPSLGIDERDVLCVTIAGLCHDLGHGPFSHLWEAFMKKADPEANYCHENMSVRMFEHMLDSNENLREGLKSLGGIDERCLRFIKELIVGPIDETTGLKDNVSRKKSIYARTFSTTQRKFYQAECQPARWCLAI